MTANKDLKRRVRARMAKTGESYTAARAALAKTYAAPRKQWPALAGLSDDAVKKATNRTWADWVRELDAAEAYAMSHRDIARHVGATYDDVSAWWAQTVTVGYERIRGLREVGQKRGGKFDANKSRTLPVDVATLYRAFKDGRKRKRWLPEGVERVRSSTENKAMRIGWNDGTVVLVTFTAKAENKSAVSIQHTGLPNKKAAEATKVFWHERLDALKALLA